MNIRVVLSILVAAAVLLWLTACTDDTSSDRPRLLANEVARIGQVSWIQTRETAPDQLGMMMSIRKMSCVPAVERPKTPRLVIGEPPCMPGAVIEGVRRID